MTTDTIETIFTSHDDVIYQHTYRLLQREADIQNIIREQFADLWDQQEPLQITTHIRIPLSEKCVLHAELHTTADMLHKDLLVELEFTQEKITSIEMHYNGEEQVILNNACRKACSMISNLYKNKKSYLPCR